MHPVSDEVTLVFIKARAIGLFFELKLVQNPGRFTDLVLVS